MDLISREAAIEAVKIPNGEYSNPSERHGIIIARVEARRRIREISSVSAVPLDKLCEWLGKFANPCKIGIRCYYPDDNNEDCMPTVECWRYVLTKWMEEQDEAD